MTQAPCFGFYNRYGLWEYGSTLRDSYRHNGDGWEGVVKDAETGTIVATCGHYHHNRDMGSMTRGPAARECARQLGQRLLDEGRAA